MTSYVFKPTKLMIPGPIEVEEEVLKVMGGPVQAHYGAEFAEYYKETTRLLKEVFETRGDVFVFVGPGSVGLDACIGSAFSTGDKVLVGVNGFFGQRLCEIANHNGLEIVAIEGKWGDLLDPKEFANALVRHPGIKGILVVHLETSTSVINPIEEISQIAHRYHVPIVVDAVSSLGGVPMHMDEWGIDFCASASQKCLGSPPGLAPVAVSQHGWEIVDSNPNKAHGWYTDLRVWRRYSTDWADWHPFPITMASSNLIALHTSIESLVSEGVANRIERYRKLAIRLRQGLRRIGFEPLTPDELLAPVITAAYGPPGIPTGQIVAYLAEVHNIRIAGGLGELKDRIIRIGHMSPKTTEEDIDRVVQALEQFVLERIQAN